MAQKPQVQKPVVLVAGLVAAAIIAAAAAAAGTVQALLAAVGLAAGFALYHASFGFTAAWRRFALEQRGAGLRAQLLMIALTILVFFPLLAKGSLFGTPLHGFVFPVGPGVVVGAFLFGLGMQLGGGCGSGTLYTVGGGSLRMLVTLSSFILGSLAGAWHLPFWWTLPQLEAVSLVTAFGWLPGLLIGLAAIAALFALVLGIEKARHGAVAPIGGAGDALRGPWPLVWGAVALALVNIATLLLASRPWGITAAFPLWGAKMAGGLGLSLDHWVYFNSDASLAKTVFADVTSVMNFGIMAGALAAAGLAGAYAPKLRIPFRSLLAAVIGGLLMGYGARLSFGCNIGAFFSGMASGSLHGLVWLLAAAPANVIGARLRPRFGL
jgi:hypothetical protein